MAENRTATLLPGIVALPLTTARQIGSGQVLVDPSALVKELIDNALDARAKSIFVDITANTIDSIQVKDDGHGIPAEDRALVCRRYCTSKIRDLHDLKEVGGKWLGFRGEALSSMAEMSGTLSITTRVEGEPVAVKLKYSRDGELVKYVLASLWKTATDTPLSTARESHPVGTTVKVTQFFEYVPVRKQTATKDSSKCLAKLRRLLQAYALARPTIRFRLHILKAKNNKHDFIYAPNVSSNMEDAVFKVISKDCALECGWTALASDGFEIRAFLPKSTANPSKIANHGAFISIDSRPVSNSRGTMKRIMVAFKERLRKSNPTLVTVKDPFFSMNIICPPDSYDPNIEPAKDDVMFDNGDLVLDAVDKMLRSYYLEAAIEAELEPPISGQQSREHEDDEVETSPQASNFKRPEYHGPTDEEPTSEAPSDQPQWRTSMYGIDEEDLRHLQENQSPVIEEEEEGRRAVEISNPWTIARMNTTIKPSNTTCNGQLLSPAKSHREGRILPSSPTQQITAHTVSHTKPLTPQTSSRVNASMSSLDRELEQNIHHLSQPSFEEEHTDIIPHIPRNTTYDRLSTTLSFSEAETSEQTLNYPRQPRQTRGLHNIVQRSSAPSQKQRKQNTRSNGPFDDDAQQGLDDTWFGQPMRGSQNLQSPCRSKPRIHQSTPLFPSDAPSRPVLTQGDQLIANSLASGRNTDIRNFFRRSGRDHTGGGSRAANVPSFTPVNPLSQIRFTSKDISDECRTGIERGRPSSQPSYSRATSSTPLSRSHNNRNAFQRHDNNDTSIEPHNAAEQFTIYEDGLTWYSRPRPSSAGSVRSPLTPITSNKTMTRADPYGINEPSQNPLSMAMYFKEYQDRENASGDRLSSPMRISEARIAAHELTNKSRLQRRRTTDGAQRTKSSKLPLERVPHGYHIQDVILTIHISIASMIQTSHKLDMRRNSLEWGYPAEIEVYDAFIEPVTERSIMGWVVELDAMLYKRYEELPGADVRSLLHEAIQKGLDARRNEEAMETVEGPGAVTDERNCKAGNDIPQAPQYGDQTLPIKVEDEVSDFDMSQFVDFDMKAIEDNSGVPLRSVEESIEKTDEEYGDDIDGDMLLNM
jgi:DNA mismatch repair protein MutL